MAQPQEIAALTKAFTGLGVDEKTLISILTKWHPPQIQSYRKATAPVLFKEDERQFERWDEKYVLQLRQDFIRFKDAAVIRLMHPWERNARLFKEALFKAPQQLNIVIEVASTLSSDALLGARRAYHSLFEHSIEEDIASHVHGFERKLLVALVSAYRYEGPHVHEERAKSDAKVFFDAIRGSTKKDLIQNDELIMILATRSKPHLRAVYEYYNEISDKHLDEDLGGISILNQAVQCLCLTQTYFCKVLDASLKANVDETARDSVTRIILTRADVDIKYIREEFHKRFGVPLTKRIEDVAKGNYKDFLLALVAKDG